MRKLKLFSVATTAMLMASLLSGCGAIVAMRSDATQFDIRAIEGKQLVESDPVDSPVFYQVRTVVVANVVELLDGYPEDNIRVYKSLTKQLEKSLKETGKYKVISAAQFKRTLEESDIDLDYTVADEEEKAQALAAITRKLGAHAYISVGIDTESDNAASFSQQMSYTKQMLIDGEIRIPMKMDLDLVRARTSETLYHQTSFINWVSGSQGLQTTKTDRLNSIMKRAVDPLVQNMAQQ